MYLNPTTTSTNVYTLESVKLKIRKTFEFYEYYLIQSCYKKVHSCVISTFIKSISILYALYRFNICKIYDCSYFPQTILDSQSHVCL